MLVVDRLPFLLFGRWHLIVHGFDFVQSLNDFDR